MSNLAAEVTNQNPTQESDRFAIDFRDFDENTARRFNACWERLFDSVRLQRLGNKIPQREQYWWRYIGRQEQLYAAISGYSRVLVCGEVSKYWGDSWVAPHQVFAGKVVVFAFTEPAYFAILNSTFHVEWAEKTASRLKDDPAYSLADTFETFPLPTPTSTLDSLGEKAYHHRKHLMTERQEGLTKTYNRFHDADENSADSQKLRQLHVEMDQAVAAAYGWTDLDLGHGFHQTKQGLRYTISEPARREVLGRLLKLNHERYAEEVAKGLHEKKKAKGAAGKGRGKKVEEEGGGLFG